MSTIETTAADDLETVMRRYVEAQARSEAARQVMERAQETYHQAWEEERVLRGKLIAMSVDHERRRALIVSGKRTRFTATVTRTRNAVLNPQGNRLDAVRVKDVREAATGALVLLDLDLPLKPMGLARDDLRPGDTIAFDARPHGYGGYFGLEKATKGDLEETPCR